MDAGHRRDSHVCLHVCRRDSRGLEPLSAMPHCAVLPQSRVKRGRRRGKRPSALPVGGRDTGHRRDSHVCLHVCRRDSRGLEPLSAMLHCRSATESCEARSSARETPICSAGGRMVPDTAEIRTSACMSAVAIPAVSSHCRRCCTAVLPQSRVKRGRRRGKRPSGGRVVPDTAEIRTSACMYPDSRELYTEASEKPRAGIASPVRVRTHPETKSEAQKRTRDRQVSEINAERFLWNWGLMRRFPHIREQTGRHRLPLK